MALGLGWSKIDGKLQPGEVVAPDERLGWGRTLGLGAQHVVAMFGATFVFPLIMGLNPQLAILMSGIATICFLLIVKGKVPSYLGTSASFVGGVAAIYAQQGTPQEVTGAILIAGVILALVGVFIHVAGAHLIYKVLPPVVTGAVVMLIGFNLAPVVANIYWPQDQWIALIVMVAVILMSVGAARLPRPDLDLPRAAARVRAVVGVRPASSARSPPYNAGIGAVDTHFRVNWSGVADAPWLGFPPQTDLANGVVGWHLPSFNLVFVLLVIPAVIALVAENAGHVKAVAEMTGADLDPMMGRAIAADGVGTVIASAVGGSPTTTYAENIGVMAATRVYSTAAYFAAAGFAILFGFSPKFGAIVSATPGGVLGGITVVLYGMIGLLGAKIWKENRVDFSNPVNLVPVAAGIIIAIGNTSLTFSDEFSLAGIALGTIVTVVMYHVARAVAPPHLRDVADSPSLVLGEPGMYEQSPTDGLRAPGGRRPRADRGRPARRRPRRPRRPACARTGRSGAPPPGRPGQDGVMKPSPLRYHRPGSLDEAVALLARLDGEGKVLAGGQSLVPMLSMRLAAPAHLVDINGLPGLDDVVVGAELVVVGALVRHSDLLAHDGVRAAQPLVAQALSHVAHPTIRNRGTTVGSVVHADPSAEMPAVLALLGGALRVASVRGEREVPAAELFVGPLETSLAADEVAVAVRAPGPAAGGGHRGRRGRAAARRLRGRRRRGPGRGRRRSGALGPRRLRVRRRARRGRRPRRPGRRLDPGRRRVGRGRRPHARSRGRRARHPRHRRLPRRSWCGS